MDGETKIIRIVVDSSKAIDGSAAATRALKAIEDQTRASADTLARLEKGFDVAAFVTKTTAAAYAAKEFAGRLVGMWTSARDSAAAITDLSRTLDVSAKFLQSSMKSASDNTVAVSKMSDGYGKASELIKQAVAGQKDAIDKFDALGVKILDTAGKLRPTEDIITNAAAAIGKIADPAKKAAAAVDVFGASGRQMLPMLADIAAGADIMALKARQAGAVIEQDVLTQIEKLKSRSEESAQKWTALVATIGTPIATAAMEAVDRILGSILGKLKELDAQGKLAEQGVIADKDQAMVQSRYKYWRTEAAKKTNRNNALVQNKYDKARQAFENMTASAGSVDNVPDPAERAAIIREQNAAQLLVSGTFPPNEPVKPDGAANPAVKSDGSEDSLGNRIQRTTDALKTAAEAQDLMTAAAKRGDQAFTEQQAHAEALTTAISIYKGKLDAANPAVVALAGELEKLILRTKEGAAAQSFVVATTELEKQNELLEAQNRLINAAPEAQAREIALIRTKQEAEKAGNALTADDVENRRAAIEANERLKTQADELKRAQELWTEPLKQALRNIQTAGADAFEQMLTSGTVTFQSLGETFGKIIRRMAAEFMALALIRPVMGVVVQGMAGAGLVSQSTVSQMGYGSAINPGILSAGTGNGGGSGLQGLGGIGMAGGGGTSMLGSFGTWLNTPFTGGMSGVANLPAGAMGPAPNTAVGGISGMGGSSAFTPLGTLGSLAGIGMGIYGLANSNGSAGSIISGASGIIGGGLGLASMAFPAMASTLGPIGLGVGLLGMLAGSFLGDSGPKIPPQPALNYGMGNFVSNGRGGYSYGGDSLNGGSPMADAGKTLGTNMLTLFSQAGLKVVQGNLYGGELAGGTDHTLQGNQWQDRPYSQTALTLPGGGIERLTYNDDSRNMQQAADYLFAQVFKANVLRGGVSGASDNLKTALTTADPQTQQATQDLVTFVATFDKLGKAANPVKDAIDKLNQTFADMTNKATSYGLSLEPLNAELTKETKRTAQDFIDNMLDPLAVQMRALNDERESALASAQYIKDNIEGVYVDMDKIAVYYTNKEAALRDQFYQGSVTALQNLIARLTYGDLANASPDTSLSGTRAAYNATLAQARAGDTSAITNLSSYAEAYTNSARSYFASGPEYDALISQIRQDLAEQVASLTGGSTTAPGGAANGNDSANAMVQMLAQAQQMNADQAQRIDALVSAVSALTAQVQRSNMN